MPANLSTGLVSRSTFADIGWDWPWFHSTRDCKGFHVEIQHFTQLLRDFIRGDHRTKFDGAMP